MCFWIWFKHILFRGKGLEVAYNVAVPYPNEVCAMEHDPSPNHTCTHIFTHTHTHAQHNQESDIW